MAGVLAEYLVLEHLTWLKLAHTVAWLVAVCNNSPILSWANKLSSSRSWQDLHSLMYIHTGSILMSSLPFTIYLKNYKWKLSKILFSCNSSHNFTPKRNDLRYHCSLSKLYFIGHKLPVATER
jgi:hypothetical protein